MQSITKSGVTLIIVLFDYDLHKENAFPATLVVSEEAFHIHTEASGVVPCVLIVPSVADLTTSC